MNEPREVRFAGAGVALAATRWEPRSGTPGKGVALLLHGGGQTRHSWQRTGERLAREGWAAITLDLRGHGDSDWAPDGNYDIDMMVADLRAVVGTLAQPPVLIGASLGGMTSLISQGEDPTFARALVLVDVTPTMEQAGTEEITRFMRSGTSGFATLDEAVDAVAAYNPNRARPPRPEGLRKNLRRRNGRWYWHWDPKFLTGHRHAGEGGQNADAAIRAITDRGRAAARAITVPTLLVRGAQSRVVSPAGARELMELVPGARQLDVSGAGHMVAGDDNDVFSAGLLDFLEGDVLAAS